MASLLEDYVQGHGPLLEAYAAPPAAVARHPIPPRPWHPDLAAAVRAYQAELGGRAVVQGDEGVIITGQQPGIFAGPLYTIYKAITAVQLAEAVQAETGERFVPIYWVGGDDHDFAEIRRVHLLNKTHAAVPLQLESSDDQPAQSIFQLPVPDALHELVDTAAAQAPGSEFAGEVTAFLHESLSAAANLSEWHGRLMARLFRETPLAIFTPDLPEARRAARPVFEREIRNPLASTECVNAGGARLEAAGYGAQVVKADDSCNFFLESHGTRCRVRYVDGAFQLPDTQESFTEAELLALLQAEPDRFTANVALRCVVQQHLFPVRAYVAGPGELAYWGQLKGLFALFELPMPVVYPRIRSVLTTVKTNKLLRKFGLRPEEMNGAGVDLEERALRAAQDDPALAVLARHRTALEASMDALEREFAGLGKSGKAALPLAGNFRAQTGQALDHLERSLLRVDESRTAAVRGQLDRLTTELAPDRKPQERYYTLFSWLFAHGWELVPRLTRSLNHTEFGLQEVEL